MLYYFNFDTRFNNMNACILQTEDKAIDIYFLLVTLVSHIILTIV